MRKALRKWVSRAHVRKGLRKQVFASALRGKDVMKLLAMADEASARSPHVISAGADHV